MFTKKKTTTQLDAPETVISKGILLEAAKISGKESVQIDGCFRGNIDIEGNLVLSDTGDITGETHAKFILIAGRVNGNIFCDTTVHLASTAKVTGDVTTKALIVDEGSQITGRYMVGETQAAANEKSYLNKSFDIVENKKI